MNGMSSLIAISGNAKGPEPTQTGSTGFYFKVRNVLETVVPRRIIHPSGIRRCDLVLLGK